MRKSKWIVLSLVLVMALALASCSAPQSDAAQDMVEEETTETVEEVVEDNSIMVYDLDGNEVNLTADGERVYIKIWASWCSVCLAGMDELEVLSSEDTDYKVVSVVSPGLYGEMEEEAFIEWWNGLGYQFIEVYLDRDGYLIDTLNIRGFPTSAYYDSSGELVGTVVGHNDNESIKANMAQIK